tara:strand:- start:10336 stop:11808 length:1473 start_codon:yes stop_codon:yes gene_type:complete
MIYSQTHISADPYSLLIDEKLQFQGIAPMQSNIFRPIFFNTDSVSFSLSLRRENYFNNNAPNQENMDVRYFSKGVGNFNSISMAFNSPFFSFLAEPYIMLNNYKATTDIFRADEFSVLNDRQLDRSESSFSGFRNLLAVIHYKGLGFGWHSGNRWWGPGIHSTLQMTNNTQPIPAQIIGTIQELRFGSFGFYAMHTIAKLNDKKDPLSTYFTSLNGQITWYGPLIISTGFSRNYLSGGLNTGTWNQSDARKIVFEGLLTSNLMKYEYTVGGHDAWDQTISTYFSIILPQRDIKFYAELGFNDNRMYLADFVSQPDHTLATIIGIRDFGVGRNKNWVYGFEWSNLMVSYSSRHRGMGGTPSWYSRNIYSYSSYKGRRWAAHSGADSDDWYLYAGYLSDKLMIIPALNYERHGIVIHRPAEVKFEFRLDSRFKYMGYWIGLYIERQYESFLGFPDYFYEDKYGNEINSSEGSFANSRVTNTLILSLSRKIDF